jgi:hypothetical protein
MQLRKCVGAALGKIRAESQMGARPHPQVPAIDVAVVRQPRAG